MIPSSTHTPHPHAHARSVFPGRTAGAGTLTAAVFVIVMLTGMDAHAQVPWYPLLFEGNIKSALVTPHPNVLKLYDIAVDERRGLTYASGSQNPHASVIDLERAREIASVPLPFAPRIHTLRCNPVNGFLYAVDPDTKTMHAIDPRTGVVRGSYTAGIRMSGLAVELSTNTAFVADGPVITVLDGDALSPRGSFDAGMGVGGLAIDSSADVMYAVSFSPVGGAVLVRAFSTAPPFTLLRTITVPSAEPLGELHLDVANDRIILSGRGVARILRLSTGAVTASVDVRSATNSSAFSPALGLLMMCDEDGYSADGLHGSWGKLYLVDVVTGSMDSLRVGDRAAQIAWDETRGVLAVTSMHSGDVELVHLPSRRVDTVDIGESADDIALAPDRSTVYIAKRLGGSRVIRFDTGRRSFSQFRAGNWPAVVRVDTALNRLFVLNVFESSISVFECGTERLLHTIALTVPEGRSDAIPTMHLDQEVQRLYIGVPELETVISVNTVTMLQERSVVVPGFRFDADVHTAVGLFQMTSAPAFNRLYLLQSHERRLVVLDLHTLAVLDTVRLHPIWPAASSFGSNLLAWDAESASLLLGAHFLDPMTLRLRRTLPAGERVVGYSRDRRRLYSISAASETVIAREHDPSTLAVLFEDTLFVQSATAAPVFHYDASREELFITEFNVPVLRQYRLNRASPIPTLALSAAALDFGTTSRSEERSLVVRNLGNTEVIVTGPEITGRDAGAFSLVRVPAASILPRDSTILTIRFTPPGGGGSTLARLRFNTNDPRLPLVEIPLVADVLTGAATVPSAVAAASGITLSRNTPNPFHDRTRVSVSLPRASHALLAVWDVLGRRVATLHDGPLAAGVHTMDFQAGTLPDGLYLYALQVGSDMLSAVMILHRLP